MATQRTDVNEILVPPQVEGGQRRSMGLIQPARVPRATPPPMTLSPDALSLKPEPKLESLSSDTVVTPVSMIADDDIELIEESGLLKLEAPSGQEQDSEIAEVSSSFLIDELDGAESEISAENLEVIEEIDSGNLMYVEEIGRAHV